MKIEEFYTNSDKSYINCERYINNGSPSKFINSTSNKTSPWSENLNFELPQIKLKGIAVKDFGSKNILNIEDDTLFVHPDILNDIFVSRDTYETIKTHTVVPTASGRTVIKNDFSTFIKLSYPKQIGRVTRTLDSRKIEYSISQSNQLEKVVQKKQHNPRFSFLKEVFGRVAFLPKETGFIELGFIVRETKPFPYIKEKEFMIPFFSLFAKNKVNKGVEDLPLIIQLLKKQNKTAEDFMLEEILFPLYHTYFDALIYAGIGLDGQGQNMMLSLDKNLNPKRIVFRDMDSAFKDITLLEYLNIGYDKNQIGKKFIHQEKNNNPYSNWHAKHSFYFDFKLGEYIVTPLLETVKKYYANININNIKKRIKEYNAKFINILPLNYFPRKWCSVENINNEKLQCGLNYIWHNNPKYRF